MDATRYSYANNPLLKKRYDRTLQFVSKTLPPPATVFDVGTPNPLSAIMTEKGYQVFNTLGEDLDDHPEVCAVAAEAATAFEIFEHLLNPLAVLQQIKAPRLFASVPLSLWFAPAYKSKTDLWDRHFHEFEDWQFDWLLQKAGWKIVRAEKWTSANSWLGIRPLLRTITPRYYMVEAER